MEVLKHGQSDFFFRSSVFLSSSQDKDKEVIITSHLLCIPLKKPDTLLTQTETVSYDIE